jgi:hypothetical protein
MYLRHNTTLEHAKNCSGHQQASKTVHKCCTHGDEAETANQQRKIVLGPKHLEEDVAWDFDEHVNDVKYGGYPIESHTSIEVQILAHALDTSITDVRSGKRLVLEASIWCRFSTGQGSTGGTGKL